MEKRVVFRSAWLPYALVAPQIAITLVFFFWPATQAVWYSFQLQDAFGLKSQFVGLQNFATLFKDPNYLDSFQVTAIFSALVAFCGIAISLLLAVMADRVLRDDERAERLLALTGLTGDDLRERLGERPVLAAVLDYLCAYEPDLVAAADHLEVGPQILADAARALSA